MANVGNWASYDQNYDQRMPGWGGQYSPAQMGGNTFNNGGGIGFAGQATTMPQYGYGAANTTQPGGMNAAMSGLNSMLGYNAALGHALGFGNLGFGGYQDAFNTYLNKTLPQDYAAQFGMAQQYMPQYQGLYNTAYQSGVGSTLAANQQALAQTGYAPWNASRQANLTQTQGEAQGQAPQYLQDFWARKANERLNGSMGAFGAPSSAFAANEFGRYNADAANQYHQQALGNWQAALNGYNPLAGMANIAPNQGASQFAAGFVPTNQASNGLLGQQWNAQSAWMQPNIGLSITQKRV